RRSITDGATSLAAAAGRVEQPRVGLAQEQRPGVECLLGGARPQPSTLERDDRRAPGGLRPGTAGRAGMRAGDLVASVRLAVTGADEFAHPPACRAPTAAARVPGGKGVRGRR